MPTHGSLSKAGKVRNVTLKLNPKKRKNPGPLRGNHRKYVKMLKEKEMNPSGRRRRRRRR